MRADAHYLFDRPSLSEEELPELDTHPDLAMIVRERLLENKRSQCDAILDVTKDAALGQRAWPWARPG